MSNSKDKRTISKNIIKHSKATVIKLDVSKKANIVNIILKDNGIGINISAKSKKTPKNSGNFPLKNLTNSSGFDENAETSAKTNKSAKKSDAPHARVFIFS